MSNNHNKELLNLLWLAVMNKTPHVASIQRLNIVIDQQLNQIAEWLWKQTAEWRQWFKDLILIKMRTDESVAEQGITKLRKYNFKGQSERRRSGGPVKCQHLAAMPTAQDYQSTWPSNQWLWRLIRIFHHKRGGGRDFTQNIVELFCIVDYAHQAPKLKHLRIWATD